MVALIQRLGLVTGFALLAAACQGSLVDHGAPPSALRAATCEAEQVQCAGVCVAEDTAHCGDSCANCSALASPDPNAAPACMAHACVLACNPGYLRGMAGCSRATAIAAGFAHTCALLADGTVSCWGANEHGQIGDGTTTDRLSPTRVPLPARARAIAAGYVHTCAVTDDGAIYCWGDNSTGSLGDGTTVQRASPVRVVGVAAADSVAAGGGENSGTAAGTYYGHTCAMSSGAITCWGGNESGQLGDGTNTPRSTAGPVVALRAPASAIAVGDRHTCAVAGGAVWCWGAAGSWQLGDGGSVNEASPVPATGPQRGATAVAAGAAHSCAVLSAPSPSLSCWGSNSAGQAAGGNSDTAAVQVPTDVPLQVRPSTVAAGNAHTCVVDEQAGSVACFGANDASQLTGPPTARGVAVVTFAPSAARSIAAGFDHTCALLVDGGIQCWGANNRGQLGTGASGTPVATPGFVAGP